MKDPLALVQEVSQASDPEKATRLYAKLGSYLAGAIPRPQSVASRWFYSKQWRREAKEARRILERRFGEVVRSGDSEYGSPVPVSVRGKTVRKRQQPSYTKRSFFTLTKPAVPEEATGFLPLLFVTFRSMTKEPVNTFLFESSGSSFLAALEAAIDLQVAGSASSKAGRSAQIRQTELELSLYRQALKMTSQVKEALERRVERLEIVLSRL